MDSTIHNGELTMKNEQIEKIHINIWDDYSDDGYVSDGKSQETYAYVEGTDLSDDDSRAVLFQLQQSIEAITHPACALVCTIKWHDSALEYPSLIGTEHERHLYKRWQLQMSPLPHSEREYIVAALSNHQLKYNGIPIVVYSES